MTKARKTEKIYLSDVDLANRYNINRVTIWRWLRDKPEFPKPLKLSDRVRRWALSEIVEWENNCPIWTPEEQKELTNED